MCFIGPTYNMVRGLIVGVCMSSNIYYYYAEEKGVMQTSGVFMISVRRGRGAIGVEGVGCGGDGWAPSQKKIVPQNDKSGCILMQF